MQKQPRSSLRKEEKEGFPQTLHWTVDGRTRKYRRPCWRLRIPDRVFSMSQNRISARSRVAGWWTWQCKRGTFDCQAFTPPPIRLPSDDTADRLLSATQVGFTFFTTTSRPPRLFRLAPASSKSLSPQSELLTMELVFKELLSTQAPSVLHTSHSYKNRHFSNFTSRALNTNLICGVSITSLEAQFSIEWLIE